MINIVLFKENQIYLYNKNGDTWTGDLEPWMLPLHITRIAKLNVKEVLMAQPSIWRNCNKFMIELRKRKNGGKELVSYTGLEKFFNIYTNNIIVEILPAIKTHVEKHRIKECIMQ